MERPILPKRVMVIGAALLAIIALLVIFPALAQDDGGDGNVDESRYAGSPEAAAPDFPDNVQWVNVDAPLTWEALRGKIVILDFWTYGCINCIHMIPILRQLEEKYPEELVVIGIHSAKFENEGETENIEQIVQRYDLQHPVVNDQRFQVWQMFGARAWPTLMVVDPRGNVLASQAGEIPFEAFDPLVAGMIDYFDSLGEINREPIELALEGAGMPTGALSFPGKVLADVAGNRLFIADSNHHRIVIADLTTYEVLDVIGTGQRGFVDGDYAEATFDQPQGMALKDEMLYVADVNNHAIRVVDLGSQEVTTLAGTGVMGRGGVRPGFTMTDLLATDLRSPWDVEFGEGNLLYIAMAGTHQIWEIDLDTSLMQVSVGNGREAALNSSPTNSELAQPSGMFYRDGRLYFADSESSTVRVADFNDDQVATISGTNENNLFDFGDVDGELGTSRLQHALGVTGSPDGLIYVADTYNSKIKTVTADNLTTTVFGLSGNGGYVDGGADVAQFDEPGGLEYVELADGRRVLFVADTNNHVVRLIDLDTNLVSTLMFANPEALQIAQQLTLLGSSSPVDGELVLDEQTLAAGEGQIVFTLNMPEGYKINDLAPSTVEWGDSGGTVEFAADALNIVIEENEVSIPVTLLAGEGVLRGEVTIFYCEAVNESLCFVDQFTLEAPLTVNADGDSEELHIERVIIPPDLTGGGIN
jgi:thiol-disulfide isomerase/thioredoxin